MAKPPNNVSLWMSLGLPGGEMASDKNPDETDLMKSDIYWSTNWKYRDGSKFRHVWTQEFHTQLLCLSPVLFSSCLHSHHSKAGRKGKTALSLQSEETRTQTIFSWALVGLYLHWWMAERVFFSRQEWVMRPSSPHSTCWESGKDIPQGNEDAVSRSP